MSQVGDETACLECGQTVRLVDHPRTNEFESPAWGAYGGQKFHCLGDYLHTVDPVPTDPVELDAWLAANTATQQQKLV